MGSVSIFSTIMSGKGMGMGILSTAISHSSRRCS